MSCRIMWSSSRPTGRTMQTSRSQPTRWDGAKRLAVALHALILTQVQYPQEAA